MGDNTISWTFDVVKNCSGSAYLKYGNSFIVCSVQGPEPISKSGISTSSEANVDFNNATIISNVRYASHLTAINPKLSDNAINEAVFINNSFESIIRRSLYPKCFVSINILVLQSSYYDLCAMITCASLTLLRAEVEMFDILTAVTLRTAPNESQNELNTFITVAYAASINEITFHQVRGRLSMELISESINTACFKCQELRKIIENQIIADVISEV